MEQILKLLPIAFLSWIAFNVVREIVNGFRNKQERTAQRVRDLERFTREGIPDRWLDNPQAAIKRWGKEIVQAYLETTEPRFRDFPDYPPDWEWRRLIVLLRDGNKCQQCLCKGFENELHVHHLLAISKGGSHMLENLITLCRACHQTRHPKNPFLKSRA